MSAISRRALRWPQNLSRPVSRSSRRFASTEGSTHHAPPSKESFGRGFYITIITAPALYVIYSFSTSQDGFQASFTRLIRAFTESRTQLEERNTTHTRMMEQAAFDRNLFQSEGSRSVRHVDLRFPEVFNTGSPINISAGHDRADISKLIEHYENKNRETEEKRKERAKRNGGE